MTMNADSGRHFSVGGVIATSFSVVSANFVRFMVIMIVVGAPAAALIAGSGFLVAQDPAAVVSGLNVKINNPNGLEIAFIIFSACVGAFAYGLIVAALTYGSLQAVRGRPSGIGECLSNGLAAIPRILLTCLVLFFIVALVGGVAALFIGMILSGVGASMIIITLAMAAASLYGVTLIWVFIPAIVAERAGALECLSRSLVLTKGHRWGIVALLLLLSVANWIVAFLDQFLTGIAPVAGTVIDIAFGMFLFAFGAVMAAVGYAHLRAEKEGVEIDDVVTVFD